MIKRKMKKSGLTLAELIIAMWIMSIILTAVATLAFALSAANDTADDTSEFQTKLRFTSFKFTELIRNCKLICDSQQNQIALWRNDDNADNQINPEELIYIDKGLNGDSVRLLEFESSYPTAAFTIANIHNGSARTWLNGKAIWNYTTFIDKCTSVKFNVDTAAPFSKKVTLTFSVSRNGLNQTYQVNTSLRCLARNLLDTNGNLVSDDD
jgi:prepilin-type N-terminal cleavage/methylation domain-containing protein